MKPRCWNTPVRFCETSIFYAWPSTRFEDEEELFVPEDHPLGKKKFVTSDDLDGQTFLLFRDIGFWGNLVSRELPNAEFVVQQDYSVFEHLRRPRTRFLSYQTPLTAIQPKPKNIR